MPPDPLSSYTATAASPAFHTLFLLFPFSFVFLLMNNVKNGKRWPPAIPGAKVGIKKRCLKNL
jgi:hypothetical protein